MGDTASPVKAKSFLEISKQFALPLWPWYLAGAVALGITNYVMLTIPDMAKSVVNGLSESAPRDELTQIALAIILLGGLLILIRTMSRILIFWPGRVVEADIRSFYFARFLKLPQTFFETFSMGDLISRLSNDVGQLRVFFAFGLLQTLNLTYLTAMTVTKMASIHWQLTVLSILPLGALVVATRMSIPKMHKYSRENQDALGRLTNRITEAFVNVHTIQANAAGGSFVRRIQEQNQSVFDTNMRLVFIRTVIFQTVPLFSGLASLVVLYYGGMEVARGNLTVGDILAFDVYIGLLTFPLTALGIVVAMFQRASTASDRLKELDRSSVEGARKDQDTKPSASTPASGKDASKDDEKPLLEFRGLDFSFDAESGGSEDAALSDVTFRVFSGERIGICGEVGSGKSTLFNIIARLYDPPPGTVFWRGRDILDLHPEDVRAELGYALQSPHLFSDTIASNLAFGTDLAEKVTSDESKPDGEEGRVSKALQDAATNAQIIDEIEKLDKGWRTEIGEKGVRLSGGQKQRLALARVFLREPELYLLDDVTSALDHATEQRVLDHVSATERTMIIASHRISAFQDCDRVYLFKAGRIIASGSLEEVRSEHEDAFLTE